MRGIHTKPIAQPSEEEAYQNAVSSLMRTAHAPTEDSRKKRHGFFQSVPARRQPQTIVRPHPTTDVNQINPPPSITLDDEQQYRNSIFGPALQNKQKPKQKKPINVQVQLSFSLKKPSLKPLKRFAANHRTQLIRLGTVAACLALIGGGATLYTNRNKSDSQGVAGATYIAPQTIFLPRPVPEGYSVGSSKQELENGAILYTVYGPKGEEITITQQAEPADFKDEVFKDALRFNTPYGIGYVIEDMERTTGFLLADDSWVLINTPRGFPSEEMRTLIRSLQPV